MTCLAREFTEWRFPTSVRIDLFDARLLRRVMATRSLP